MWKELREMLLSRHIGAILIALLLWQATVEVVSAVARAASWFFASRKTESVFGWSSGPAFQWDRLIFSAVAVALYLLAVYGLIQWLFPREPAAESMFPSEPSETEEQPEDRQ